MTELRVGLDPPISPFFYQIKNFLFLLWVNLYTITGIYLHAGLPILTAHFS